jgi:predicted RNA-binding protein YlqC (UPF0109 family)
VIFHDAEIGNFLGRQGLSVASLRHANREVMKAVASLTGLGWRGLDRKIEIASANDPMPGR